MSDRRALADKLGYERGIEEGRRLEREEIMEGAVKTWVCPQRIGPLNMRVFELALSTALQQAFPDDTDREVYLLPAEAIGGG